MPAPTTPVQTTALDQDSDNLAAARQQILDAVQKLNEMIASYNTASGLLRLNADGRVDTARLPPLGGGLEYSPGGNLRVQPTTTATMTGNGTQDQVVSSITYNARGQITGAASSDLDLTALKAEVVALRTQVDNNTTRVNTLAAVEDLPDNLADTITALTDSLNDLQMRTASLEAEIDNTELGSSGALMRLNYPPLRYRTGNAAPTDVARVDITADPTDNTNNTLNLDIAELVANALVMTGEGFTDRRVFFNVLGNDDFYDDNLDNRFVLYNATANNLYMLFRKRVPHPGGGTQDLRALVTITMQNAGVQLIDGSLLQAGQSNSGVQMLLPPNAAWEFEFDAQSTTNTPSQARMKLWFRRYIDDLELPRITNIEARLAALEAG